MKILKTEILVQNNNFVKVHFLEDGLILKEFSNGGFQVISPENVKVMRDNYDTLLEKAVPNSYLDKNKT